MRAWFAAWLLTAQLVAADAVPAPQQLAWSPDGAQLAITDSGRGALVICRGGTTRIIPVGGAPLGIAWSADGSQIWVGDGSGTTCSCIEASSGAVTRRFSLGRYLRGIAALPAQRAAICVAGLDQIGLLDQATGTTTVLATVGYQPEAIAATPDGQRLVVVPLLPVGAAVPTQAVSVAVIASMDGARIADIPLLPGATAARGVAITPDGRWALVTHVQAKANMPNTHVDLGWVSTNAVSILDLRTLRRHATVLLDHVHAGSADPWGVAVSPDGATAWVALSGIEAVARIDLARLLARTSGVDRTAPPQDWPAIWAQITRDPTAVEDLAWDLNALPLAGLLRVVPIQGQGPRGIAVSPDGRRIAVAAHFDGSVRVLDAVHGTESAALRWAPSSPPDAARRGEALFHNANNSYQRWVSCATCHPDVRSDGINWDLLNDGVGNPKNTRSLLLADRRAPVMSLGVRKDGPTAVRAGFRFIAYHEPTEGQVDDLLAFLRSLEPIPSPHLTPEGGLTTAATRGKALFEGKASCIDCHAGPTRSDQKPHDVGTVRNPLDAGRKVITPMLMELWRTAPYLHDGSAATLHQVVSPPAGSTHGDSDALDDAERNDLIAYLLSL